MPSERERISQAHLTTGRAVDQLRRQLGIAFQQDNGPLLGACPIEGLTSDLLNEIQALTSAKLSLLITGARARNLKLTAEPTKSVRIDAAGLTRDQLLAIADPLLTKDLLKNIRLLSVNPSHDRLLTLAKYASLLPALLIAESIIVPKEWLQVSATDVGSYWENPPLDVSVLSSAKLPIEGSANATLTCFRTPWGTSTHLALVVGDITKEKSPLVRVHSSCVTGDILGSLRCDCGDQLQLALKEITNEGAGILLYLHQEGRGIGIANKLRAYALQEQGVDTYEANLMLGFDDDERDFRIAASMLKTLGVKRLRLLTNNPHKLESLQKLGISIDSRVAIAIAPNKYNHGYLDAKAKKSGHLF